MIIENPQDTVALKEVRDLTGKKVVPVMAVGKQIKNITEHYFNTKHEKEKMISLPSKEDLNLKNGIIQKFIIV